MSNRTNSERHVGELLSGFVDGELTQQDRQRVCLHCESCDACHAKLDEIRKLRRQIGSAQLTGINDEHWRETMKDTAVNTSRGIGWLLLIGGVLLAAGAGVVEILSDSSSMSFVEKVIVGGIYGGLLLIFISVLRQRLIERKTDKYNDVEI